MKSAHKTNEKSTHPMTTNDARTQQVNKHQNMSGGTTSKRAQFNKNKSKLCSLLLQIYQEVKHRKFVAQHKAMAEKKKNKSKKK
jgi:hypothetical protein